MPVRVKKRISRRSSSPFSFRKKACRFCRSKTRHIDYKDVKLMEGFIKERGKIVYNRITGNCAKHQRRLTEAIKKARYISLLPYSKV